MTYNTIILTQNVTLLGTRLLKDDILFIPTDDSKPIRVAPVDSEQNFTINNNPTNRVALRACTSDFIKDAS